MTLYPVIRAGFVNLERNLEIAIPAPNRGGSHVTQDPMRAVGMPTTPTVSPRVRTNDTPDLRASLYSVMLRSLLSPSGHHDRSVVAPEPRGAPNPIWYGGGARPAGE